MRTARKLFPTVFGLPPPVGTSDVAIATYTPLTDYVEAPAAECLNLLGQPALVSAGLSNIASSWAGMGPLSFTAVEPLLFRDRRAGFILALPSGAKGEIGVATAAAAGDLPELARHVFLDRLVLIEPSGTYSEMRATATLGTDGIVELCPDDPRRAAECSASSAPGSPARWPFRYEITRCATGCDSWCPSGTNVPVDCSRPPTAQCHGKDLEWRWPGQDIGARCQYEEWTLHCGSACSDGRCDAASPSLRFTVAAPTTGSHLLRLADESIAVFADDSAITFSPAGRELRRDLVPSGRLLAPIAAPDGAMFLLGSLGEVRKVGGKRPWSVHKAAAPGVNGGLALAGERLYVALGATVFMLDAQNGSEIEMVNLPAPVVSAPVVARSGELAVSLGTQIITWSKSRPLISGVLPEPSVGEPAITSDGKLVVATSDGSVHFGAGAGLHAVARFASSLRFGPVLTPDSGALFVTQASASAQSVLHRLALPSGRELWSVELGPGAEQPLVDARGHAWVSDSVGITAIDSGGHRRWSLDLRGQGGGRARLGGNGALYFRSFRRLTALEVAAASPFHP